MKRLDKGKIITIISFLLILIGVIILFLCLKKPKEIEKTKEEEFKGFTFKNVTTLEYGAFSLSDFVEDITCEEECTYKNEKIDYKISDINSLGTNEITVTLNYKGKEYNKTYQVELEDTTAPEIIFNTEDFNVIKNSEFDPLSFIEKVEDNYDDDLLETIKVTGIVSTKKLGDYKVIYEVMDSSENKKEVEVVFHVVEDESVSKEENNNKPNQNNSNNNTNNNPNKNPNNTTNKPNNNNNQVKKDFKSQINSISLNPIKTRYPEVDNKVDKIIASTIKSNMTNYEKLAAVYDYVKNSLDYEMVGIYLNSVYDMMDEYHYTYSDAIKVYEAYASLETNKGVCDNYSALFMILARRLGFDAYFIGGEAPSQRGGRSGHAWVTIKVNGTFYFFDPQIEDHTKLNHFYFGKTEKEMGNFYSKYSFSEAVNDFNLFKETNPIKVTANFTGAINKTKSLSTYTYDSASEYIYETLNPNNSKLNLNLSLAGDNPKYQIEYYDSSKNTTVKLKEGTGKSVNAEIDFKESGTYRITIRANSGEKSVKYELNLTLTPADPLTSIDVTYEKTTTTEGRLYIPFKISTTGGEGLTYSAKIINTDHENPEFNHHATNKNQFNLYYMENHHYEIEFSATDNFGNTKTKTITIDV